MRIVDHYEKAQDPVYPDIADTRKKMFEQFLSISGSS